MSHQCDSIWEVKALGGISSLNLLFVQLPLGSQSKDKNVIWSSSALEMCKYMYIAIVSSLGICQIWNDILYHNNDKGRPKIKGPSQYKDAVLAA